VRQLRIGKWWSGKERFLLAHATEFRKPVGWTGTLFTVSM
jgi:hypothetical protein